MANHRMNPRATEGTEGWHSRSHYAVPDNADQGLIGQPLDFASGRNVRPAFSAATVEPMACGATGDEDWLALGRTVVASGLWHIRLLRSQLSGQSRLKAAYQQYQHRQSTRVMKHRAIFVLPRLPILQCAHYSPALPPAPWRERASGRA